MKKVRTLLSCLLAIAMFLSLLAPTALAVEAEDPAPTNSFRACAHGTSYVLQDDSYEATDTTGGYRHYKCAQCGAEYSYATDPMVYEVNPKTGEPITLDYATSVYLPNYEFMPDNELHVFWSRQDNEWRVYAVGSHDTKLSGWCGPDITCWSAPVYDLTAWRFEAILRDTGTFFACDFNYDLQTDQAVLYAFPFFGNSEMQGTHLWVNGHSVPDAYFNIPLTEGDGVVGLDGVNHFDPAIYIAEDGTMLCTYDDSTGGTKHCQIAKVNANDRTKVEWTVDVKMAEGEHNTNGFAPKHYEGSTIDRVDVDGHSYWVVQYSYKSNWSAEDYEKDVDGEQRWWPLAYVYSDPDMAIDELKDFAGWHWGGIIGDNGGFYRLDLETGEVTEHDDPTVCWGNNHGGLAYINGQWYLSNHRHTSNNAGRQGFLRTVDICVKDGKLAISTPEYTTSMGDSIDAYHTWSADKACHLLPTVFSETHQQTLYIESPIRGVEGDYWATVYANPQSAQHLSPIVGITDGAEAGYKYLNFGADMNYVNLTVLVAQQEGYVDGTMDVYIDAPSAKAGGTKIGSMQISAADIAAAGVAATSVDGTQWSELTAKMDRAVSGIHGVYFVFHTAEEGNICKLDEFTFTQASKLEFVTQPESYVGAVGSTATFTAEATGDGLSYQWYYSNNNGKSFARSNLLGANTNTLSVTLAAYRNGQQYKCVATDQNGDAVHSQVVAMTVAVPTAELAITSNPESFTGAIGATATFTVKATGEGLSYQWYYSNNGGKTFAKSTLAGANTESLSVSFKAFRAGQQYKCVVTDVSGSKVESAIATLGTK